MSDLKQTVGFLQKVPLFHNLNNRQLEHLAKRMIQREYSAGQTIVQQGQGGEAGAASQDHDRPARQLRP